MKTKSIAPPAFLTAPFRPVKSFGPVYLFLIARFLLLVALPLEGLRGYGDLQHFYRLAGLGWPFRDVWVEFPPVFAFLSTFLYKLAGGREHVYDYILVFILIMCQAGSLALFMRIARQIHSEPESQTRGWMYAAFTTGLAYGWWYFDPIAVFLMLLGVAWLVERRDFPAGMAIALGVLTKLFPAFALALAWRIRPSRRAAWVTALALAIVVGVYATLYIAWPQMTAASLRSQGSKGSWETVWALVDGNLHTGNFGPLEERYDAANATLLRRNPPRLPPLLTLVPFAILGVWLLRQPNPDGEFSGIAFLGLAWCLFLLWSPGWSPQWVLYLLPLIFLVFPQREALLLALTIVLANLLEWPILLSRGFFWGLWITIPVREFLLLVLSFSFGKLALRRRTA